MAEGLRVELHQRGPIPLNVSLSVAPGETLALVGASGAGKSTILRTIAGLHRASQGRILCAHETWFDQEHGIDLPARSRRAGVVFQSYALFPHKTALGNVAEAMLELPRDQRHPRAAELLEQVQLDGLEKRFPHQLSGGQQQRVALARALARDPRVLLLDEPFSAVDQPTRRALQMLLSRIRRSTAIPILIVSHDVEDASRSADRLCYLKAGETVEQGTPRAMLDNPETQFARWLNGNS
ncbi:ABC transporter ATP-binding protein [Novosphingobium sp. M1R2S20]|uniref:ABC transporter ATP-binding protein n=1 Tax=Novosphingobium rhizovicinum TaxID=3228928 RepID=A0ABV3RDT8_9SPHN